MPKAGKIAIGIVAGITVALCVSLSGFDTSNGIIFESSEAQMGPVAITQRPVISLIGAIDFGADANRSASRAIDASGIPVLVVHGTGDEVISYDGASILAQRDNVTNPHVRYITMDEPGRNGHNTYFYSRESQAYLNQCGEQLQQLQSRYDGDIPEAVLNEFMAGVDKYQANTANPDLIDQIDLFYAEAIGE